METLSPLEKEAVLNAIALAKRSINILEPGNLEKDQALTSAFLKVKKSLDQQLQVNNKTDETDSTQQ